MKQNLQELLQYLQPTGGAVITSVTIGLFGVLFLLGSSLYSGSDVQFLARLSSLQQQSSVQQDYEEADATLSQSIVSDLPLLVLWAGVGLIAYWLGMWTVQTMLQGRQLRREMNYVHANAEVIWRQALLRAAFRVAILIIWVLFISLSVHGVAPYITALVSAGKTAQLLTAIEYIGLAAVLGMLTWYGNIVFARLLFLRGRLFG